ncbi:YggS family pyridoxal phosphate-dependent enzyme [Planctomicrobium sp. SH668]|uniref:YggS family pyridoxal phosphate-dependent enzyme n=1 Tax=Planctomicrobium sp. SH668 TaxID=3448126 RepID=UPI003F5B0988
MSDPSLESLQKIRQNLDSLNQRIEAACTRAHRSVSDVRLIAVTKYASIEHVVTLLMCGHQVLGENRPQQLIERSRHFQQTEVTSNPIEWHLIGQLQSNKIRSVLPDAAMIHSVESLSQLQRIGRIAGELSLTPNVLLQVNVSGEQTKSGFEPETLRAEWEQLTAVPNIAIQGLMTMAPLTEDSEAIRLTFRGLCELRNELRALGSQVELPELSMGMSHDFEIAIEEGATLIRVGSAVFDGVSAA